jgi:hypothetical protein
MAKSRLLLVTIKLIVTVGALVIAVVIASLVQHLRNEFYDIIGVFSEPASNYLDTSISSRLDVLCAVLIPISTVLWWRGPSVLSKRVVACCLGIAAAFVPVLVQVTSWPFIVSSGGPRAVAAVAVFAAATLAVSVTAHFMKEDAPAPRPIMPRHIRRGLLRLYIIVFVPWGAWFGYEAYWAKHSLGYDQSQASKFWDLKHLLDDPTTPPARLEFARRRFGLMADVYDAKTIDELGDRIDAAVGHQRDRFTTAIYALLASVAPALLYPFIIWVLAGFVRPASNLTDAR